MPGFRFLGIQGLGESVGLLTVFLGALVGLYPERANAGRIQLLGGLDFTAFSVDVNPSQGVIRYDRKLGQVYGLELDFSLSSDVELAIGGNYVVRNYGLSRTLYTINCWEFPVLLRLFMDRVVAVQAGVYGARGIGFVNISYIPEDPNTPGSSSQVSFDTMNMNRMDYGVIMGLHVATDTPSRFAFDLRYLIGLTNVITLPSYQGSYSAFEVMLSFTLFGGKGR